ncbi:MAG: DUF1648 domain-containing protein [Bryobacteraceae bacterium]|nr:DUF1648 domain-containing protein [Bryobacteraceae bacterium]
MDLHGWVTVSRLPIEIAAACLAVLPALLLLRAWGSLPDEIPAHFGLNGRPDRWGGRWQAWIVPLVAVVIYGAFSHASGAWGWLLGKQAEVPHGMEPLLLMRLPIDLLMTYITWGTIRVACKEADGLSAAILWGLLLLTVAPAIALPFLHH